MKHLKLLFAGFLIAGLAGAVQAKVLFQDDFSNWRDETTNPGFNATKELDKEKGVLTLKTNTENNFGKIMSAENGITLNIDENTTFSFKLLSDIPKGDLKINLMTSVEPYDSHEIIQIDKAKEYSISIASKTPWSGKHSFWIEMWVEGFDRTAKITDLKFTDGTKPEPVAAPVTKKKVKGKRKVQSQQ
jgi:hypothetical protein